MTLGDYIKDYRQSHKYSMDDFAKQTGMSKAYVSILERNFNPSTGRAAIPSLDTIKRVATATNVDFNDLIAMLDGDQQVLLSPATISPQNEIETPTALDEKEIIITGQPGTGKSKTLLDVGSFHGGAQDNNEHMQRVFISMAHQDRPTAEKIRKMLESVKFESDNNWVYMIGHDGSYRERQLDDMQFSALNAILDQMPDTTK